MEIKEGVTWINILMLVFALIGYFGEVFSQESFFLIIILSELVVLNNKV